MKSRFEKFKLEDWIRSDDDLVALLNDALASANDLRDRQPLLGTVLGAVPSPQY